MKKKNVRVYNNIYIYIYIKEGILVFIYITGSIGFS